MFLRHMLPTLVVQKMRSNLGGKHLQDYIVDMSGVKMCIVLIDANAHFSTAIEPCIGQHGLERRENRCASCFAEFLQMTQLFLPATFAMHHIGQTATWKNPKLGTQHRCDYIAVPQSWAAYSLQSWVDGCFELGRANIDHLAVLLECKLPWMRGGTQRNWPQCAINRWQICNADPGTGTIFPTTATYI